MKKMLLGILIVLLILPSWNVYAKEENSENLRQTYVLMEQRTKKVISEQDSTTQVPIGTMCKLMTILLAAQAVDEGNLQMQTMLAASSEANSMQGAQIWLMPGEMMSVEDLLKGVIIGNANDAAVVLAEAVSGSEDAFVNDMNAMAFDLGMRDTRFVSASGYAAQDGVSTAYDMALLCCELAEYEELYQYMSCWRDFLRGEETELVNENELVKNYKGIIGFKAGHSEDAGNCLAVGAQREDMMFIAVVLGCEDEEERFSIGKNLLNSGFSQYAVTNPAFSNEHIKPLKVKGGVDTAVEIEAVGLESLVVQKGAGERISSVIFLPEYIEAPVRKGQKVGVVAFYIDDALIFESELVTSSDVEKMTTAKAFKIIITKLLK